MTTNVANFHRMFIRVQGVLNEHAPAWENHPFISGEKTALDAIIGQMEAHSLRLNQGKTGDVRKKARVHKELQNRIIELQGYLLIHAAATSNENLAEKIGRKRSAIYAVRKEAVFVTFARTVVAEASLHVDMLAGFNFTAEDLQAVQDLTTTFSELVAQPQVSRHNLNAIKQELEKARKDGSQLLRNRLDPAMFSFKLNESEFYYAYRQARTLINRPARFQTEEPGEAEQ